jgi:hypothetical protein
MVIAYAAIHGGSLVYTGEVTDLQRCWASDRPGHVTGFVQDVISQLARASDNGVHPTLSTTRPSWVRAQFGQAGHGSQDLQHPPRQWRSDQGHREFGEIKGHPHHGPPMRSAFTA